uniref:Uncharacterized protein n=1 Tax=Salix viminalis TaxID=40686 RepID=A0A6N2KCG7_SALVM
MVNLPQRFHFSYKFSVALCLGLAQLLDRNCLSTSNSGLVHSTKTSISNDVRLAKKRLLKHGYVDTQRFLQSAAAALKVQFQSSMPWNLIGAHLKAQIAGSAEHKAPQDSSFVIQKRGAHHQAHYSSNLSE